MTDLKNRSLVKLGDTDLTLASKDEDVRGRSVIDNAGEKVGEVSGLMIDDTETKVRFLEVAAGGILGIGDTHFLIPVDAITSIDKDHVHIDQSSTKIKGAPKYDPSLVPNQDWFTGIYGHYGYSPYWMAGYSYPAYPYYGRR
jgi:sporulation protein YlmC with PRC-barrel domain